MDIWYFSDTPVQLILRNKIQAFYEIFFLDIFWARLLVYWAFRDI